MDTARGDCHCVGMMIQNLRGEMTVPLPLTHRDA